MRMSISSGHPASMAVVLLEWLFLNAIAKKIAIKMANAPAIKMECEIAKARRAVNEIAMDM
jgi:hypothetical protein